MNSLRLNLDKQNICRKQLLQEYLPDVSKEVYWNAGGPIHRPCVARSGHTDLCLPNKEGQAKNDKTKGSDRDRDTFDRNYEG